MDDQRAPDHSDDPRGQDTGQGYPESNPAGSNPEGTKDGEGGKPKAPSPSSEHESDAGVSTGNPHAAGA